MADTNINLSIVDGIYDIQPLVEPAQSLLETTLSLGLLAVLISLLSYTLWLLFYSNKALAQRKIKKLRILLSTNEITSHDAAYQLSYIIQQGLELNSISSNSQFPEKLLSEKERWTKFVQNMSVFRYTNGKKENTNIEIVFSESLYWLKKWP